MESHSSPRPGCLEATFPDSSPQSNGAEIGVPRRLFVGEISVRYCSRLHRFLGLSLAYLRLKSYTLCAMLYLKAVKKRQRSEETYRMANEISEDTFEKALSKSVKDELRAQGWPIYEHYEVMEEEGEAFVVAPLSLRWVPQEETGEWRGHSKLEVGNPVVEVKRYYSPLRTPELVVDLAYLAEKEITAEVVLRWAKNYGLLGVPEDDVVQISTEFGNYHHKGQGRRESVARFAEVADEIRTCLRDYEAANNGDGPLDLEALSASSGPLPMKVLRPWERRAGEERRWVLRVVGRMVQTRISEHCYPKLSHYPGGRFALSYGFKNLLGAVWLQMAWLLSAHQDDITRCELLDCFRVITFEPGEQPPLDAPKGERGKYKTREDRKFCKDRPCKQKYHYRKKAGWPGYV
jgi:hypothetical protein